MMNSIALPARRQSDGKLLSDRKAVVDAIRLIVGEGNVTELRALNATQRGGSWPATYSGYFNDPEKLADAVGSLTSAKGIYFIPNPVRPDLIARACNRIRKTPKGESTSDSNITARYWLLIDADAQRPSGISATDAQHQAAIQRTRDVYSYLRELGWPEPIAADSGNGGHLLYRIDLPVDDGGIVKNCLHGLARLFDDDIVKIDTSVHNPSRIWKLYGTVAAKGDDAAEVGRPHRRASITNAPDELVTVETELLKKLAKVGTELTADPLPARDGNSLEDGSSVADFISRHELDVDGPRDWNGGKLWTFLTSPMCDHHADGPFIAQHANGAISARCMHNSCDWTWNDLRDRFEPREQRRQSDTPAIKLAKNKRRPKSIVEYRPFPTKSLPEPVREIVEVGAKAIGADESFVALPVLSVLASAIGTTRLIELKKGWTEPSIIWAAIVGDSGSAKSPSFQLALRPLINLQKAAVNKHTQQMSDFEKQLRDYDRQIKQRKRDVQGEPLSKPTPPQLARFVVKDATIEALAPLLKLNPRGVLMANDELDGWIQGFGQYKGGRGSDRAHWLSMHSSDMMLVDRKTGDNRSLVVERPCVSVCGGIQPGTLCSAMGKKHLESGLCARLLFAMPPRRKKQWSDTDISPVVEGRYATLVSKLLDLKGEKTQDGVDKPVSIRLSPEAQRLFIAFYDRLGEEQGNMTGNIAAAWSKLEAYCARFALIIHCVRSVIGDVSLRDARIVDAESLVAAIELVDWFCHSARKIYGILEETELERDQRQLIELIQRKDGTLTARELSRSSSLFNTTEEAELALSELAQARYGSWGEVSTTASGGRPTRRFTLNPKHNADETSKNAGNGEVLTLSTTESAGSSNSNLPALNNGASSG